MVLWPEEMELWRGGECGERRKVARQNHCTSRPGGKRMRKSLEEALNSQSLLSNPLRAF